MKREILSLCKQFYQKTTEFLAAKTKRLPPSIRIFLFLLVLSGGVMLLGKILFPSEIVIGLAYSTNPSNQFMESRMFSAARAYVDWHNETSRGRKIKLVTANYLMDPTAALGELKEKGALGVIGFTISTASLEALPGAAHYQLPLISVTTSTSLLSQKEDWFFRVHPSTAEEARETISMFEALGIFEINLVSFSGNPGYVVPLVWDIKKRGEPRIAREFFDLSIMEMEPFRDVAPFSAPLGILVVGPPIYSLWIAQKAHYLWPSAKIVFSLWSLMGLIPEKSSDFPLEFTVFGGDTFFPFLVNTEHPFVRYWDSRFISGVDALVNNTYLAFTLLLDALEDADFAGGETLRQSLGRYRKIPGLAGEIEMDRYGDAHAKYFLYRFNPQGYEEVLRK